MSTDSSSSRMTVDDHPLLRQGIAALLKTQLDLELVAQACHGEEAIGETAVKNHVSNILSKLGANDRAHAVTIALQRGIIELKTAQ